jgi:hypothetical protein
MTIFAQGEACSFGVFPLQGRGNSNPEVIRRNALSRRSLGVVGALYEQYFERLLHLRDDGWYEGKAQNLDVGDGP